MSSLPCRLIAQVAFKAGGDVYHRFFTDNPHHLTNISPSKFHTCDLHQGAYATEGSILQWKFTLDGKEQTCKHVIQNIDEEKKQISYKFIEGDLLELYKNLIATFHVETRDGIDYVTWTVDYELLDPANPHPLNVLQFAIEFTADIEAHHMSG